MCNVVYLPEGSVMPIQKVQNGSFGYILHFYFTVQVSAGNDSKV